MPNETRVNLKHLLEDLRDAYSSPIEEVIVTELIANALDSGATHIRIEVRPQERFCRCVDDGCGMNRAAVRSYHNIAASAKERGAGIGFAGVGAKLSLLVAEKVETESRGKNGTRAAAQWHLLNAFRAPWKFIPFRGLVEQGKGTAVTIFLKDEQSRLLDVSAVTLAVQRHFYSLVCENEAMRKALGSVYKKPVSISINGQLVRVEPISGTVRSFFVQRGKSRKSIGAGFVEKASMDENFWSRLFGHDPMRPGESGLRISTYGKVIRGGWEWLGVNVKHPELLTGVVEVPALAEILTTNKSDFLTTPTALKKYYDVRKAIQHAVVPILRELGEVEEKSSSQKIPSAFKPLTQDIEGAISLLSKTFPELEALVGEHMRRRLASQAKEKRKRSKGDFVEMLDTQQTSGKRDARNESAVDGLIVEESTVERTRTRTGLQPDAQGDRQKRMPAPGIEIAFEDFKESECDLLGKLIEEKVIVNTAHPSWQRAKVLGQEPYHVLLTVALTLGDFLQSPGGITSFVGEFLKAWSMASAESGKLL